MTKRIRSNALIFFSAALLLCTDSDAQTDSLSLKVLDLPDSAVAFSPLTFRVAYNTGGRDLRLNTTMRRSPTDFLPFNHSEDVVGKGEVTYTYRMPDDRRSSGFYITAYLTRDGTWAGRELLVSSYDSLSHVQSVPFTVFWNIAMPDTIVTEKTFETNVVYMLSDSIARQFPYLILDLVNKADRVVARQIEWSVPERASFTHAWKLPATLNVASLKLVARLELDGFEVHSEPLASGESPFVPVLGCIVPDYGRIAFHNDTVLIDGKPTFFNGVDVFSFWYTWDEATIQREVHRMHDAGINYIRLFLDWNRVEPSPGQFSEATKKNIKTFLRTADSLDIWVELVPVGNWGGWVYNLYRDHWWTDAEAREANERYFFEIGRWLDSLAVDNIFYVSVMQEGSWYFDWFDPFTENRWGSGYPGEGSRSGADADWRSWCTRRKLPYVSFDSANAEIVDRWLAERYADLLYVRAQAIRHASRYRFAIGAEGVGSSNQYDRRVYAKHTVYYSLPEFWAHVVDCFEVHCYRPIVGSDYWSGSTGLESYRDWTRDFRKPVNVGETNWTYAGQDIDMSDTQTAWPKLKEKLELIRTLGYTGYAIWSWMDYDARKLGLNDLQFQSRPILDSLTVWIRGMQTSFNTIAALTPGSSVLIWPVPVRDRMTLSFDPLYYTNPTLIVTDMLGRQMLQSSEFVLSAEHHAYVSLNTHQLASGIYRVHLFDEHWKQTSRLFPIVR